MSKLNITLFIIILLFNIALSSKNIISLEGDQLDHQINLCNKMNSKLFIIFYVNNCQYCDMALKILENQIVNNFEDEDEIYFSSINLDNQKNIWLGLRFNVTRIPYIILIEKEKIYSYDKAFEDKSVLKFINDEKNIEDGFDIPPKITFMDKLKAALNELSEKMGNVLEIFGINKNWGIKLAYFFIFFGLISFIYLENKLIENCRNFCWKKRVNRIINDKKKKKEIKTNNNNEKDKKE